MVHLINRVTGVDMWAHETRVEKYLAAGHRLAAAPAEVVTGKPDAAEGENAGGKPRKSTRKK